MTYWTIAIILYAYGAVASLLHVCNEEGFDIGEVDWEEIFIGAALTLLLWPVGLIMRWWDDKIGG